MKWSRLSAGHYASSDGRFRIDLEDNIPGNWFLTDTDNPNGLYGHCTLNGCKIIAEEILTGTHF